MKHLASGAISGQSNVASSAQLIPQQARDKSGLPARHAVEAAEKHKRKTTKKIIIITAQFSLINLIIIIKHDSLFMLSAREHTMNGNNEIIEDTQSYTYSHKQAQSKQERYNTGPT